MAVQALLDAGLSHHQLNSFLIEYEARKMGLDSYRFDDLLLHVSERNGNSALFRRAAGPGVSYASDIVAMNKYYTKLLWDKANVPHNPYLALSADGFDDAVQFAEAHDWNVVLKPAGGWAGKNVFTNIKSASDMAKLWSVVKDSEAYRGSNSDKNILVERKFKEKDYRFFVIGGEVAAAMERVRPFIAGDGVSTVDQLIEAKIVKRKSNPDLASRPLKKDRELLQTLRASGLSLSSVLPDGKECILRGNANLSTGGESWDITDKVPSQVKSVVLRAVQVIPNVSVCAVDVLARDIYATDKLDNSNIVLNEIETDPGMCIHHFPMYGPPRNLAKKVLQNYFTACADASAESYEHDFDENLALVQELVKKFTRPQPDKPYTLTKRVLFRVSRDLNRIAGSL